MDKIGERVSVLYEAAAAVCPWCDDGARPVYLRGEWVHREERMAPKCEAGAIHHLIASTLKPPVYVDGERWKRGREPRRRIEVYRYIVFYNQTTGRMPALREIVQATDITSTSVVSYYLRALERAGLIRRLPFITRGIELTRPLFTDWLTGIHKPTPAPICDHPAEWATLQADEGTAHCWACELVARVGLERVEKLAHFYCREGVL